MRRVFRPGSEPPKQEEVLLHGKTGPCISYPRPSAWCCQHPTAELECPSNNKATVNLGARKDDVVEEAISRACLLWFCGLFGNRITVLDKREWSNEEIGLDDKVKSKLILSGASAVIWLKFSMKHLCGLSVDWTKGNVSVGCRGISETQLGGNVSCAVRVFSRT